MVTTLAPPQILSDAQAVGTQAVGTQAVGTQAMGTQAMGTQATDTQATPQSKLLSCSYVNMTSCCQIIRMSAVDLPVLEKTLFPSQAITFKAPTDAELEVYSCQLATTILEHRILCQTLVH